MLLALQRTAGNRAVGTLLGRRRRLQRTPLIESDYFSLGELRKVVTIKQTSKYLNYGGLNEVPAKVEVSVPDFEGVNELSMGTVGQQELADAADAGWQAQAALAYEHPELGWHASELEGIRRISFVSRNVSGSAIKRVADLMTANITQRGKRPNSTKRTQEGIANMFLHDFGQAIITTLWGRAAADLSGDIHERDQPALIHGGKLTAAQERQAIDNYCDLVNNIHGQAWGEAALHEPWGRRGQRVDAGPGRALRERAAEARGCLDGLGDEGDRVHEPGGREVLPHAQRGRARHAAPGGEPGRGAGCRRRSGRRRGRAVALVAH